MKADFDKIVQDAVSEFDPVRVVVHPTTGSEGDPLLGVTIVYDEAARKFSAEEMATITRAIWTRVQEAGEEAFPITSFMSLADFKELDAA